MDRLMRNTLDGWKDSKKDERYKVKIFDKERKAEEAKELMRLLLEINGYTDEDITKELTIRHKGDKCMLKMPKSYHTTAIAAERYTGI